MDPERYYNYDDFGKMENVAPKQNVKPIMHDEAAKIDSSAPETVYRLDKVPGIYDGPVLVAGFGTPLKNAVRAAKHASLAPIWVTGTEDKLRAFTFGEMAKVVPVGNTFDERLFANEFAVLWAAQACKAETIIWANKTEPSELLLSEAARAGISLLVPATDDRSLFVWEPWANLMPGGAANNDGISMHIATPNEPTLPPAEWRKCPHCRFSHDEREVRENAWKCPTCGELYRLNSDERIENTFDAGSFVEVDEQVAQTNPMDFPDYDSVLERAHKRSNGLEEAVRTGFATIDGMRVAVGIMESTFMMGSMGSVVGEKLARLVERATEEKLPVVFFCASGGARMQEGLASLMQMAKVSAALEAHSRAGLLYISVITDPTTGGVTASFATLGDIILAEPHALIGFAGRRVIQNTIKQTLPSDFQTAEFALEHGLIDAIVERSEMRSTLSRILRLHGCTQSSEDHKPGSAAAIQNDNYNISYNKVTVGTDASDGSPTAVESIMNGLTGLADWLGTTAREQSLNAGMWWTLRTKGVADYPNVKPKTGKKQANHAWESVQLARNAHRPTSNYYIQVILDDFIELHGDRSFADDAAIIAGIGTFNGTPVTVIAEEKGADLKDRIARNFGCPQPEGYRKAQRLMRQAEKFGRPIVCLVDTQGAFCGKEAEERGMGNAISESLQLMAGLTVPVVTVIIGEGGSGGALALAVSNRVAMQENAVYSVLSPEGFASILWKDGSRAPEAAEVMKMTAADAMEMGIVEDVIPEGPAPAHENPEEAAAAVWLYIANALDELQDIEPEELRNQRYDRFRKF